ncbi:tetratricopeptide repeat protein [Terriglobus tenax]|uniref:tetratricopeptide repeat protein n=1 Tax=Terriglobus tenax TaxID=1111115 RepID=UPI0021E0640C|nr:tetratricopeptide repeat protein [Terriglobus tenax]
MQEQDPNSLELVRAAALRGVAEAQVIYGQMLLDGKVVERNALSAFSFFERAAKGGNVMAINMVGRCLDQGWGVAASPHLAAPWFLKAAERGLDWGMYNYATLLILGRGVPEDRSVGLYWLRKAAELGHAKSINLIGGFYEDGWEVEQNRAEARECYRLAAVGGDFRGQFNFARFLAQEGETQRAFYWLRQVPKTATPAFLEKMRKFLAESPIDALRHFAASLDQDADDAVPAISPEFEVVQC